MAEHDIELLPGTKPIKQQYYPVLPDRQRILNEELKGMLKLDVNEPSRIACLLLSIW